MRGTKEGGGMIDIREMVDQITGETEEKIRAILQDYHDRTGMIPQSIGFHNIDITQHDNSRKHIAVSHVVLRATT